MARKPRSECERENVVVQGVLKAVSVVFRGAKRTCESQDGHTRRGPSDRLALRGPWHRRQGALWETHGEGAVGAGNGFAPRSVRLAAGGVTR